MIEIIPYEDRYHQQFREINLAWLDKYHLTESHDLMVLDNPRGTIIDQGGYIWLVRNDDEIIGSAALVNEGHGVYELAKMTVSEKWQGKGISKMLMDVCLGKARECEAKKVILYSNHQLKTALSLYEKYGFRNIEVKDAPFLTADVKMELNFNS